MWTRRRFLESISALPVVGGFIGASATPAAAAGRGRDYLRELGVRPFINAAGTYTAMTASLMPEEVMDAINYASKHYVMLDELHDKVGERIAKLVQAEGAMVTSGAASALTLGTAAVLTGGDNQKMVDLPNLANMKSEVIMQKSHRFGYDHAVRNCGVQIVEVETREDLERAVNPKTAMMLFYNNNNKEGRIQDEEFVQLGKKHGIPTFNDAAADVPPVENLWKYTKMGFDLVAISGGKGIRGPQSAGMLLGRKDLIEAARKNAPPNGNTVGRGMKVNKEEMLGMLAALGGNQEGSGIRTGRHRRDLCSGGRESRAARACHVGRCRARDPGERSRSRPARWRTLDRRPIRRSGYCRGRLDDASWRGQDRREAAPPSPRSAGAREDGRVKGLDASAGWRVRSGRGGSRGPDTPCPGGAALRRSGRRQRAIPG
jgi:uncharacterized pyridoxal phosphate-dependent enzyme